MGILPRLSFLAFLGAAGFGGVVWGRPRYLPDAEIVPGLRIDGELVTGNVTEMVGSHAQRITGRKVHLKTTAGDDLGERTLSELGISVDVDAIVARARRVGHDGNWLMRMSDVARARRGEIDIPLSPRIASSQLVAILVPFKETLDSPPASARLDLEHRSVIHERPGRYLDAFGALPALLKAASDESVGTLLVPLAEVAPRVTTDFVQSLDVHTILAEFETYFSRGGDQKRRGQNIDVAAAKLDGVVFMPGEIVSFNVLVGDRSEENGFQKSWEIYKGEMVEGVGGGTCQVASTLHAAAFFGGFEMLERLPHSRPSAYIPMGLDSTVVYPIVDLKLRNPHAFPVVVHTKTDGNKLTVQLLGAGHPTKVSFSREVLETKPYTRKIEEDAKLSGDHVLVKQHGIRGYRIKRTRTVIFDDGRRKVETNVDVYPPATEVYAVPPDFDTSKLPPLPEVDEDGNLKPVAPAPNSDAPSDATAITTVKLIDAPGAHAPTAAQKSPDKTFTLSR